MNCMKAHKSEFELKSGIAHGLILGRKVFFFPFFFFFLNSFHGFKNETSWLNWLFSQLNHLFLWFYRIELESVSPLNWPIRSDF